MKIDRLAYHLANNQLQDIDYLLTGEDEPCNRSNSDEEEEEYFVKSAEKSTAKLEVRYEVADFPTRRYSDQRTFRSTAARHAA